MKSGSHVLTFSRFLQFLIIFAIGVGNAPATGMPQVAVVLPTTGAQSDAASVMRAALEMAYEDAPGGASFPGLVWYDDLGLPDSARLIAERLMTNRTVVAVLAGDLDDCALEFVRRADLGKKPLLLIAAPADTLTRSGSPWVFRVATPTSDQIDGVLGWAVSVVGAERKIALIQTDQPAWDNAAQDLKRNLEQRWRGEVVVHSFKAGQEAPPELLRSLAQQRPTIVGLAAGTADAARFLKACRNADWSPAAYFAGTTQLAERKLISAAEGAAEYLFAPVVWLPSPTNQLQESFSRRFTGRYGEPPNELAAEAYAAMQVIIQAWSRSPEPSPAALREALEKTDLATPLGQVRFQDYNGYFNQNRVETLAVQLQDGVWRTVWPLHRANARYIYPAPDWRERRAEPVKKVGAAWQLIPILILLAAVLVWLLWQIRVASQRRRQ